MNFPSPAVRELAPPALARWLLVIWTRAIKAFWMMSKWSRASVCFALLIPKVIARSKRRRKSSCSEFGPRLVALLHEHHFLSGRCHGFGDLAGGFEVERLDDAAVADGVSSLFGKGDSELPGLVHEVSVNPSA